MTKATNKYQEEFITQIMLLILYMFLIYQAHLDYYYILKVRTE